MRDAGLLNISSRLLGYLTRRLNHACDADVYLVYSGGGITVGYAVGSCVLIVQQKYVFSPRFALLLDGSSTILPSDFLYL